MPFYDGFEKGILSDKEYLTLTPDSNGGSLNFNIINTKSKYGQYSGKLDVNYVYVADPYSGFNFTLYSRYISYFSPITYKFAMYIDNSDASSILRYFYFTENSNSKSLYFTFDNQTVNLYDYDNNVIGTYTTANIQLQNAWIHYKIECLLDGTVNLYLNDSIIMTYTFSTRFDNGTINFAYYMFMFINGINLKSPINATIYIDAEPIPEFGGVTKDANITPYKLSSNININKPILQNGTSDYPYLIYTFDDLVNINNNLDACYVLKNDIDASITLTPSYNSGRGWMPIGGSGDNFYGTIDGNGYKIKNLYCNNTDIQFGYLSTFMSILYGTIKNLGLENCNITGVVATPLVAVTNEGSTISNCYTTGNIHTVYNLDIQGGIGTGFVWENGGNIENCYSLCDIKFDDATMTAGFCDNSNSTNNIKNCYYGGRIRNYNTNDLFAFLQLYPFVNQGSNVTSCYYNQDLFVQPDNQLIQDVIATGLTTTQMKTQSSYSNWDFTNVWAIDTNGVINNGYPYLKKFNMVTLLLVNITATKLSASVNFKKPSIFNGFPININALKSKVNTNLNPSNINNKTEYYKLERRELGDNYFTPIGIIDYPLKSFEDGTSSLKDNTIYEYRIKQISNGRESSYSTVIQVLYSKTGIQILSVSITPNPCDVNNTLMISVNVQEV